jgi:serine/threonine protein kinase/Tol biopolymer transport system component
MQRDPPKRVSDLYHAALARQPEERSAFLKEACEGDENLRLEVESLLRYESAASRFLETPAAAVVAVGPGGEQMLHRQIGSYRIAALLGAGGMGEVYRARDSKLGRDVAIKILPAHLTADPERRSRFAREARLLAALNHPHIGAIYGLEEFDGVTALVLELVEGPTLADRLERGPLAIPEAVAIARQVAEALDEAHEKGIVHRDLKPGNIVLQGTAGPVASDVRAKVLDFGLAKTLAASGGHDLTGHPTGSFDGTAEGRILGTPAYMSPEQARGQAIDKRTDIWAFGCVLYEMLAGRPPFAGDTMSDTFVSILEREPDWAALPATTPASILRLLERCLRKDPRKRLHDVADALIELDDGATPAASGGVVSADARGWFRRNREGVAWIVAALAVALVAVLLIDRNSQAGNPGDPVAFTIDHDWEQFAISPDGRHVAFTAIPESQSRPMLWIRSLDTLELRTVPDTEGAAFPFWRPDSQAIGFFAGGQVMTVPLNGGAPFSVCRGITGQGTWNQDDVIVFGGSGNALAGTALQQVAARGGTPVAVTSLTGDEFAHGFASFLPDGDHFLYLAQRSDSSELRVGSLTSPATTSLGRLESHAEYAAGYLFSVREGSLVAQPFDAEAHQVKGSPSQIAAKAGLHLNRGLFSVSATGRLAYSKQRAGRTLTWVDRQGRPLSTVGPPGRFSNLDLSPDDRHLAVSRTTQSTGARAQIDLWLIDVARSGVTTRLTHDPGWEWDPEWSPKGTQIAFNHQATPGSNLNLFVRPSDASGRNTLLAKSVDAASNIFAPDWSHDGRFIIYSQTWSVTSNRPATGRDLWLLPMMGDLKATVFLQTRYEEWGASFSPDDRWITYTSNATGRREVYVRPFPVLPGEVMISRDGGALPRWRGDGKEMFFVSLDGMMMSVEIDTTKGFTAGVPQMLFPTKLQPHGLDNRPYVVANDGQRFLIPIPDPPTPISVLLNWPARIAK